MPTLNETMKFCEDLAPTFGRVETMLYVGHRYDTNPWWRTTFRTALGNPSLDVLDVQRENLDTAGGIDGLRNLILDDVRNVPEYLTPYDLVFWDGGPEHLPRQEALDLLKAISSKHRHVLIGCPWGYQLQGKGPTDWEFHHWGPMPEDFINIGPGWQAVTHGVMFDGQGNGHGDVHAWV